MDIKEQCELGGVGKGTRKQNQHNKSITQQMLEQKRTIKNKNVLNKKINQKREAWKGKWVL